MPTLRARSFLPKVTHGTERISPHILTETKLGASDMKIIRTFCARTVSDILSLERKTSEVPAAVEAALAAALYVGVAIEASTRRSSVTDLFLLSLNRLMQPETSSWSLIFERLATVLERWPNPFHRYVFMLGLDTWKGSELD